jgi:hypothetical protein
MPPEEESVTGSVEGGSSNGMILQCQFGPRGTWGAERSIAESKFLGGRRAQGKYPPAQGEPFRPIWLDYLAFPPAALGPLRLSGRAILRNHRGESDVF